MQKFQDYLIEDRNTHLEHLEDEIINNGTKGAKTAIEFLKSIKQRKVEDVNFLEYIFLGQESQYKMEPVSEYKFNGWEVEYTIYKKQREWFKQNLITS